MISYIFHSCSLREPLGCSVFALNSERERERAFSIMTYGKILEIYRKHMGKIWEKYRKIGLITGHLSYRRAIGSIGDEFAASISSSLSPSRPPGPQKCQKSAKNTAGRSFLDSSFFPYKIVVVVVVVVVGVL